MIAAIAGGRGTSRALATALSLALCAGGLAMLAQGAAVPIEARVAQVRLEQQFDRALAANLAVKIAQAPAAPVAGKVWIPARPPASPAPTTVAPGKPLARIMVERLGVRDVVLAGPVSHDDLARGPMVVRQGDEASPVTVLAAHRDTHFEFVRDLAAGDMVTLHYVTGEVQRFRVTHFETVRWDRFTYPRDPARPLLALATCWPFSGTEYGGPWRRVAWAEAV